MAHDLADPASSPETAGPPGYAVVDLETTGLRSSWHDRVIEIGVVHLSPAGEVTGEWNTLVNPGRDLGPQHVHGVRAADVRLAPAFGQVARRLAGLLRGRVLAAHNLPFEVGFLAREFERLGVRAPLRTELGVCTMAEAARFLPYGGRGLARCCALAGVPLEDHHDALADARAAAGLLRHYIRLSGGWRERLEAAAATVWPAPPGPDLPWVRRGAAGPRTRRAGPDLRLRPGDLVAFTGDLPGGREDWETRAERAGYTVHPRVTRRVRVLVAADPDTLSRKAGTARAYGVPILTPPEFAGLISPDALTPRRGR
ncbi:DNA polymerase III subunit epsilon [Sphaerisporangium krabiense]|uniref:DNA polymerase-3 subunit epsilon n=1 Tax=Sphaerisporangium krabiense TaxID=763782 RepID=A0A7W8Z9N3_9ACTN|nr:exonuclease domain-containing protein [Sphaerisporangium krabiense]MBB5629895.1 DNA polymerase-3 subunit epsilon [Sphaerisporangium krabiense]GII63997.1 DNA polymerase III subunit epsilon [Sphaerisporangium krabiense]